jgi:hypothetical protein
MSAEARTLFAIGARLGMSVASVERLSTRELVGWVEFFARTNGRDAANDGATELQTLSREQLRAMFDHDRG